MKAGAFLGDALADPTTAFSYKLEDTAFKRINGASIYEMCVSVGGSDDTGFDRETNCKPDFCTQAADKAKGEVRSRS